VPPSFLFDPDMPPALSTTASNSAPIRGASRAASTASSVMRSSRLAVFDERAMILGSSGSASRAHAGTSAPVECASQITRPKRSTSRRSGAVTWAYGAPTAACSVSVGGAPSNGV